MSAITKIHGFNREGQNFSSQGTQLKLTEVVEVEAATPLTTIAQVVNDLPNTLSGPGGTAFNPMRLTFTLFHSRHPFSDLYYLESVQGMRRSDKGDRFWNIPLTYSTPPAPALPGAAAGGASGGKKSQKVKKPDGKKKDQKAITNPLERPADFKGSTKAIVQQRYHDLDDIAIMHTNGILITRPIAFEIDASNWTWTWNISMAQIKAFMEDGETLTSTANNAALTLKVGNGETTVIPAREIKCTGVTYDEAWETPSSDVEYHYVQVSASFLRTEGIKWDTPPNSMHTLEISEGEDRYKPIEINERGTKATAPWPLKTNGRAVPYAELKTFDPDDFGKVITADGTVLKMRKLTNFQTFFDTYNLTLPRVDA